MILPVFPLCPFVAFAPLPKTMPLLNLTDAKIGYGGPPLLDGISIIIEPGERIGLLGRNGAGKSTLMKVIAGEMEPDDGEIQRQPGLQVARLTQEVPAGEEGTIYDVVAAGLGDVGERLAAYHHLTQQYAQSPNDRLANQLDRQQHELDTAGGWDSHQLVDRILSRMNLNAEGIFSALSSGMKRRVLLARALVLEPDILLLDEPTNHLDIESITWLEEFLAKYPGTLIFVTHDRVFLQKLATRIVEIERGRLFDWTCDYQTFLKRKEEFLEAEARQEELFDKKLAEEERWIRQGIKARRTRNEGRVRALQETPRRAPAAKNASRQRADAGPIGRAVRATDLGSRERQFFLRRPARCAGFVAHADPRRPRGADRPQRVRQNHAVATLARRVATRLRHAPAWHESASRLFRPTPRPAR